MRSEQGENRDFLTGIAKEFFPGLIDPKKRYLFVFPNRRSGIYFKRSVSKTSDRPLIGPDVYSMGDLVKKCTGIEIPDNIELVFRLFSVVKKIGETGNPGFADFYREGLIILSDFSDIDKNLVDQNRLFKTLRGFYNTGGRNEKLFSVKWEELGNLYAVFKDELLSDHIGYEGMVFRAAAENIDLIKGVGWDKIVFCGFNSLSGSEKKIIKELTDSGIGIFRIEMDSYFMDNPEQEAGTFAREYLSSSIFGRDIGTVGDDLLSLKKSVVVHKTTSDTGQAKIIADILENTELAKYPPEDIAVVLPDESLLFPVLNSLPLKIKKGNITLGYPLSQTSLFSLLKLLIELNSSGDDKSEKDVERLTTHPLIKLLSGGEVDGKSGLKGNIYEAILLSKADTSELIELIKGILERLLDIFRSEEEIIPEIETEFIYHFYRLFEKIEKYIEKSGIIPDRKEFAGLFGEMVRTVKIPFTGEPLEGIQILGVIEAQNLRFKMVIIPSMNDSIFPGRYRSDTFIPSEFRPGFGLSLDGEKDAIAENSFYRLIGGAESVHLIYIDESEKRSIGERSRFISQILLEYASIAENSTISEKIASFPVTTVNPPKIEIEKSESHLEKLKDLEFSPTSLRTFISCSLKFYFRYIERIKEKEEQEDSLVPLLYGKIIHRIMEKIYKNSVKQEINIDFFENLDTTRLHEIISASFHDSTVVLTESGRNRLAYEIIFRLIKSFIEREKKEVPFTVLNVERTSNAIFPLTIEGKKLKVKLKGIIDRIDKKNGILRIIDYKTGKVSGMKIKSDVWNNSPDWKKYPEVFQLLLYALLLKNSGSLTEETKLNVYPLRDFSSQIEEVLIRGNVMIGHEELKHFEIELSRIFESIFSKEAGFSQTDDKKVCRNCSYRYICDRNEHKEKAF